MARAARAALAAVLAAAPVAAQVGFTYGRCGVTGSPSTFASGDRAQVCLHINGKVSAVFNPRVDEMAALELSGSNYFLPRDSGYLQDRVGWVADGNYSQPTTANTNCTAGFVTQTLYATLDLGLVGVSSSVPRVYKKIYINPCTYGNGSDVDTLPLYTAIVTLDKGAPTSISWDDGCFFCASNGAECVSNALDTNGTTQVVDESLRGCKQPTSYCYPASSVPANGTATGNTTANATLPTSPCDLKVFVTWTGTDANGKYLTSAGRRFSRYRQYGTASVYQGALNVVDSSVNLGNRALSELSDVPGRVAPGLNRNLRETGAAAAAAEAASGGEGLGGGGGVHGGLVAMRVGA